MFKIERWHWWVNFITIWSECIVSMQLRLLLYWVAFAAQESAIFAPVRSYSIVKVEIFKDLNSIKGIYLGLGVFILLLDGLHPILYICWFLLEEWHRFDPAAPWMGPDGRPGPSPFKPEGNVFERVPGCTPERIKPDLVHTFHIGFGADLAASMIVWMAKMNKFGRLSFDDKLRVAYSMFQEYCHHTKRYTACDEWCMKKFSMSSFLGISFLGMYVCFLFFCPFPVAPSKIPGKINLKNRTAQDQWLPDEFGRQGSRYWGGLQVAGKTTSWRLRNP